MAKQKAFYFDSSRCSGCKTCQIACKDKHNLNNSIKWRKVYEVCGGDWVQNAQTWISNLGAYNVSLSCNHCQDPICMKSCPNKAIYKTEEGVVLIDESKCMGCQYCEWACPYDALTLDKETGVMTKCTMCYDYLEEGKEPACVAACPMRVLEIGDLDELERKYGKHANVYPLPPVHHTRPSIVINEHPSAQRSKNWKIINQEEVKNASH